LRAADQIDLGEQRVRLVAAVRDAGAGALAMFGGTFKSWLKDQSSPVSEADIASNELLHERLALATPDFGWLSEESRDDTARQQARHVWVIDPIDGTRAYMAGRPDWTVSAALVEDGRPVVAVLFAPVTDEMFVAVKGEGATLNGMPITVSSGSGLAGARVAGPKRQADGLAAGFPDIIVVPTIHSLALRLARVAHGAIDVAIASSNSRDWDLAAADLLVHEAGGAMTGLAGQTLIYNRPDPVHESLIASGSRRHAALIEVMGDRRAGLA
jgi:myo-inositol-1(or 4)-monophosphatase